MAEVVTMVIVRARNFGVRTLFAKPEDAREFAQFYGLNGWSTELRNVDPGAVSRHESEADTSLALVVAFALWCGEAQQPRPG
jgi:hypothetical protein